MDIQSLRVDHIFHNIQLNLSHVKFNFGNLWSYIYFLLFLFAVALVIYIVRKIVQLKYTLQEQSIFLELTPPAITQKTAYTTQQLFSVLHDIRKHKTLKDRLLERRSWFSFEIVSTQDKGIRYVIRTSKRDANNLKRNLLSYLPQVRVKEVPDYLPESKKDLENLQTRIIEFKLTRHFAYPLENQDTLEEHDPVAYITGQMTKLAPGELVSFQMVLSPTKTKETKKIKHMIIRGEDVLGYLDKFRFPTSLQIILLPLWIAIKLLRGLIFFIGNIAQTVMTDAIDPHASLRESQAKYLLQNSVNTKQRPARVLTTFEQESVKQVESKIDQRLFQAQVRLLLAVKNKDDLLEREQGFISSLAVFSGLNEQALVRKFQLPVGIVRNYLYLDFRKRLLSFFSNSSSMLLSTSEVSDFYHFPYRQVAQTENLVKVHSKELPAPLSLKNGSKLDVIFGVNTYGGTETPIGQTEEERKTHTYILGRTGSGKSTMMFSMAKHDIEQGRGIAFVDPHGDIAEDLLACVPESRKNDLVYVNPIDLKYPIGINVLELTPGLNEEEAELEKEVVAEGVVSLFRKVFSKEENVNAHRIEHILRNTIYTAFTLEERTIFTINKILTNPDFRKKVIKNLQDEDLKDFWKYEFGKAGDYQVVKMTQGVTAKVGRFLRSPTARRMLDQTKSTINFDDVLNGKILICNFSQGKLGEDTSRLMGITILTKLQQAALQRANLSQSKRKPFYLYVDEFQNFATQAFSKMLSEGRKYALHLIIAEQSTSQQQDRNIVHIILANITTLICFRSGNIIDEQLMLGQFTPYLQPGDIMNLPRYKFYIKKSALDSEEPFSGETIKEEVTKDQKRIDMLITASRKNWAKEYIKNNTEVKIKTPNISIQDIVPAIVVQSGVPNTPEFEQ